MKQTITKSDQNLKILNKLVANGFYNGYVGTEKFELIRNHFPNNYRIIGILNNENKFELNFYFKKPTNVVVKIAIGIGLVFSIILLVNGTWFLTLPFFIIPFLITFIDFKLKKKKEIKLLISKLLEFYKSEY